MKYTIYTYGGGEILGVVFNAIAALFKNDGFEHIVYVAAVMFGFWVLVLSVIKNQAFMPLKWMVWFWMITTVMLYPRTSIMIYDPITKYERKVDSVPLVLGAFASYISGLGHGLTSLIETFLTLPDYQKYGEHGNMFASKILKNMGKYRIRDGTLKENMERFIQQCVMFEALMGGKYTIDDLHHTKDIWSLVRDNGNPINGFSYRDPTTKKTTILSCKAGAQELDKKLNKHGDELSSVLGREFLSTSNIGSVSDLVFGSIFKEKLTSSYSFMSGIAASAENILKQEMMINSIEDVKNNYAVSKATVQQRSSYLVTGELASSFLVAMKVVLETLAYVSFIFIVMLVMLPNGIFILGQYLGILLWLQLWAPLYAVLNLVMSIVARHQSQGVLGSEGLSMMTSVGLSGLHADIEALAAFISGSIPFISYGITQGGVASFMNLAGSMTSAMQGVASSVSNEIASGNLSMNNVSYAGRAQHMSSGFKYDDAFSFKSARMEWERQDGSQGFMTPHGNVGVISGAGINMSSYADKINMSQVTGSHYNNQISKEKSQSANYMKEYSQAKSMAEDKSVSLLEGMAKNLSQNRSFGITHSDDLRNSMEKTASFMNNLHENEGYTQAQAASLAFGIGVGRSGGFGLNGGFDTRAAYEEALQKAKGLADNQGVSAHISRATSNLDQLQFGQGMNEEKRLGQELRHSLSNMQSARIQAELHESEAMRLQNMKSMEDSLQINSNRDMTHEFESFVADKKGLAKAQEILSNSGTRYRSEKEALLSEFYESQVAKNVVPHSGGMESDSVNQRADENIAVYNNDIKKVESDFIKKISGDEVPYGKFNAEQAMVDKGEFDIDKSKYYNDYAQEKIFVPASKPDIGSLSISGDISNPKTAKKYQTYTTEDNKKINIVNEVRGSHKEAENKIEQQNREIGEHRANISNDYQKESNTSRLEKVVISALDVVKNSIPIAGLAPGVDNEVNISKTKESSDNNFSSQSNLNIIKQTSPKTFSEEVNSESASNKNKRD